MRHYLEVILDFLDIMGQELRRSNPSSIVKDTVRLAQVGVGLDEGLDKSIEVGNVNLVALDLAAAANGLLHCLLLGRKAFGASGK